MLAGLFNGMMGMDPSMLGGQELDAESMEKLAALASGMGSMNVMEDLQMRSKILEQFYSQAIASSGHSAETLTNSTTTTTASASSRGDINSPSHARHRKSATVTKPATETAAVDEAEEDKSVNQPEDLSIKQKTTDSTTTSLKNEPDLTNNTSTASPSIIRDTTDSPPPSDSNTGTAAAQTEQNLAVNDTNALAPEESGALAPAESGTSEVSEHVHSKSHAHSGESSPAATAASPSPPQPAETVSQPTETVS